VSGTAEIVCVSVMAAASAHKDLPAFALRTVVAVDARFTVVIKEREISSSVQHTGVVSDAATKDVQNQLSGDPNYARRMEVGAAVLWRAVTRLLSLLPSFVSNTAEARSAYMMIARRLRVAELSIVPLMVAGSAVSWKVVTALPLESDSFVERTVEVLEQRKLLLRRLSNFKLRRCLNPMSGSPCRSRKP
jgi:hypothetical protein